MCEFTWKEFGGKPPCGTCRPELTAELDTIIKIYCRCAAAIPVPILEAIKLADVDDIEYCVDCVQLMGANVDKARLEARDKK